MVIIDAKKSGKQASKVFFHVAFLDQSTITKVIGSYPNEICFDAKVSDYFRQWKNKNRECMR